MEAKRIKLDCDDSDSRDSTSRSSASSAHPAPESALIPEVTVEELQSQDPQLLEEALKKLKTVLRNKATIEEFMTQKAPEVFAALIGLLTKAAAEIGNKESTFLSVLKESISVIANICNYSVAACLKLAQPKLSFTQIAVRVFESGSVREDCKTSMARLIANMCMHKEPAYRIATNSSLVDRLVQMLECVDDKAATQAFRAVRGLVAGAYIKALLLSNVGFYLGKMLVAEKNTRSVVQVLMMLATKRVRDTGRQLAGSDCAESLLELFFSDDVPGARELVLLLCEGSTDIRDRMGEARAIERVVDSADHSTTNCKLLVAFAQEAWGRAALRESGALDFLISRLSSTPLTSNDRLAIVQPLRHFVHDTNGMAYLVRNRAFTSAVVNDVKEFLAEYKVECKPEIFNDEDRYRPDSPLLMEIESGLQKKKSYQEPVVLHKDYSSLWAYSTPSSARSSCSPASSPIYTPPSSGAGSPVSASSISPFASSPSNQSQLSNMESDMDDVESKCHGAEACCDPPTVCVAEKAIESELWLLAWQAQEDANLAYLGKEDIVNAVLSYLAMAPSPDYRIGRVLLRLASSRRSIESLLSMQFHTRVLHTLCMPPCRVVRYARRCDRCERAAEFGRAILRAKNSKPVHAVHQNHISECTMSQKALQRVLLCIIYDSAGTPSARLILDFLNREFASHVDSDFGNSFLIKHLSSENFTTRVVAAIAKVALIRDRFRLGRMSTGRLPALDLLFESIRILLLRDDFVQVSRESTYSDGPPLCAQIVGSISTLIPQQRLREILEVDAAVRPQERGDCVVEKYSKGQEELVEMLVFETNEGDVLAQVPMDAVCKNSQYFQGMFASDLFEKVTGVRTFTFSPKDEDCSAEDFTCFLHFLTGCRSQCTTINSAETCVALVKLSDRYLCSSLSDYVCSPHGPVRRLVTGETLPVFLPAVLTTHTHQKLVAMCLLTLVRYCSSSLVVSALCSICHSHLLVDTFIEQMKELALS